MIVGLRSEERFKGGLTCEKYVYVHVVSWVDTVCIFSSLKANCFSSYGSEARMTRSKASGIIIRDSIFAGLTFNNS